MFFCNRHEKIQYSLWAHFIKRNYANKEDMRTVFDCVTINDEFIMRNMSTVIFLKFCPQRCQQ
jgi:hypothetical protein